MVFLDPYYNTAPNIWGTQEGIIILTTTQIEYGNPKKRNEISLFSIYLRGTIGLEVLESFG